jgi:ribokinase
MDILTRTPRFPLPGETLKGISVRFMPGGKGANQAVALARLGAAVEMIGAIGDDLLGKQYAETLAEHAIGRQGVLTAGGASTGTASITVTEAGENEIIIVPGANGCVSPAYIGEHRALIENAAFLLLQLEIPLESVIEAASIAHQAGNRVILDPAPAVALPDELLRMIDVITPNETEATILSGVSTDTEDGIRKAGEYLLAKGIRTVIIKAGKHGAYALERDKFTHIPGFTVKTVDTVAAGDSFNAGFAFALHRGYSVDNSIKFANAVAAISTTKEGAQTAMPTMKDVEEFFSDPSRSSSAMFT